MPAPGRGFMEASRNCHENVTVERSIKEERLLFCKKEAKNFF
jgi:hypothetical protein